MGVLDDAIKSRITWHLFYRPLDWNQTKEIWALNLKYAQEDNEGLEIDHKGIMKFAKLHFRHSRPERRWNGRQIQNAFKVATSLAEWATYEGQQDGTENPENNVTTPYRLSIEHFEAYATETEAFGDYLQETQGFTEAERAFQAHERADDYNPWQLDEAEQSSEPQDFRRSAAIMPPVQTTYSPQNENYPTQAVLSPPFTHVTSSSPRVPPVQHRSSNSQRMKPSIPSLGSESTYFATQNTTLRRFSSHNAPVTGNGAEAPSQRFSRTMSASQSGMSGGVHNYQSTAMPNRRGPLPPPPSLTNENMYDTSDAEHDEEDAPETSRAYEKQYNNGPNQANVESESEDNDAAEDYLQPQQHQNFFGTHPRSRQNYSDRARY